jgi:AhpD family alkylhydroperoxidase
MARLEPIETSRASGRVRELLSEAQARLGMIPNLTRALAHSPAALEGFLRLSDALESGALPDKLREQISLAVAQRHGTEYGVAEHAALGRAVGLSDEEIMDARHGRSSNSKVQAALRFASQVIRGRGDIADEDWARLCAAGYSSQEIVEILAWIGLSTFTDYFAQATQTDADFPKLHEPSRA